MIGKRSGGRPRKGWCDDVDEFWNTVNWQHQAQDLNNWHRHDEPFIQQWIENG